MFDAPPCPAQPQAASSAQSESKNVALLRCVCAVLAKADQQAVGLDQTREARVGRLSRVIGGFQGR
jgi:hypothetical protein